MAVDELLNPPKEIEKNESWIRSRMRICAVGKIIKRLDQLELPEMISDVLKQLKLHV